VSILGSEAVENEMDQTRDDIRRSALKSLYEAVSHRIAVDEKIRERAREFGRHAVRDYDALHLACAEPAEVDVLLTTDEKLIRRSARVTELRFRVMNPVDWLVEVLGEWDKST
jgi:predicted nucleic acid-binding protein